MLALAGLLSATVSVPHLPPRRFLLLSGTGGAVFTSLFLDISGNPGPLRMRRALNPARTRFVTCSEGSLAGPLAGGEAGSFDAVALSPFLRHLTLFIATQRVSDLDQPTDHHRVSHGRPKLEHSYQLDQAAK